MSARAVPPEDITPEEFFTSWAPRAVNEDPERRKKLDGLDAKIQFDLAGEGGGSYQLRIIDGAISGASGHIEDADVTLQTDLTTWRKLNAGTIKAPVAVMQQKLKFKGSMFLALKIHFIIG